MLPHNPPKVQHKFLDLAEVQDETAEYHRDQHYDQVQIILARNKRIEDMRKGIKPTQEITQDLPFQKSDQRAKKKSLASQDWSPFEDM